MNTQDVIVRPIITERATQMTERENKVMFEVDRRANKHHIRDAVETTYGVKVEAVHTLVAHGKLKRRGASVGRRPNWKKAIVKLKQGDTIDFFATE